MIELKGNLKSVSALDSNVYILTTESGKHVGDLTIVDEQLINKVDTAMETRAKATGQLKPGELRRVPTNLPVTLIIKVRQ